MMAALNPPSPPSAFTHRNALQLQDGRLFAIFVSAPGAAWETDKAELIKIRDSFQVYDLAE